MRGDFEADPPVWISKPDGSGAAVETDLLDAARRNWARVLSYAQRYEQDSSVAADILETVLLAISRARGSRRNSGSPIRNLDSYLYVAFIRRLNRHVAKQPKIEFVGSLQDLDALSGNQTRGSAPTVEDDLLVRELLRYMNQRARHTFLLRTSGYSWKETASFLRTTANSAQVLFNKGVGKARGRIMKVKGSRRQPGEGGKANA
jgi:DNA-directed RNA polymerase specialized sigma24 family protein